MITTVLAALVAGLFGAPTGSAAPVRPAPAPYVAPIVTYGASDQAPMLEDSPLWDCRMHGNGECGPGATVPVPIGDTGALVYVPWEWAPAPAR